MAARAPAGSSREPRPPVCGFTLDDLRCRKRGDHMCAPRVAHARAFFEEVLLHTKGVWARKQFLLARWQLDNLIRPVFGPVTWSPEYSTYARRVRIVWIELARKQGKSEILAGIALYLLVADGEESAEIYGAACDRDQARKVFDVAKRMVELSPVLSRRLRVKAHEKRIIDERTSSVYEVIAADAAGNLGHNPHGVVFDEVLTQPNGELWDALRTGMGTRAQALMVAATTPGNDRASWCGQMHVEMEKVADDPTRAPHIHAFLRNTPDDADPWDEANWSRANPALGEFLSIQALREEAVEARNDPSKENAFRQYRLAQWVRQTTRWMPMHLYASTCGEPWPEPSWGRDRLLGRVAWAGFDLAAKFDLCAWALVFPDGDGDVDVRWRFWLPEGALPELDKRNDGRYTRWVRDGWIRTTDGDVLDYDTVYEDIAADARDYAIRGADGDQWSSFPVIQELAKRTSLAVEEQVVTYQNTYAHMSPGMSEVMALVKRGGLRHHGNPVAAACFDAVEVRKAPYDPELVRPEKPERAKTGKRIDAVPAVVMAVNAWKARGAVPVARSVYETRGVEVV